MGWEYFSAGDAMKLLERQLESSAVLQRMASEADLSSLAQRVAALAVRANRDKYDTEHIGVVAVFRKPNLLLLAKRRYAPEAGKWALPGGHVKHGESLEEGARREVLEEVGLQLGQMKEVITKQCGEHTVHVFFCRCDEGRARALSETAGVKWADVHALPSGMAWDSDYMLPELVAMVGQDRIQAREYPWVYAAEFQESQHPRDTDGKFSSTYSLAHRHGLHEMQRSGERDEKHPHGHEWRTHSGGDLPEHVKKLGVPPAWQAAHFNPDPSAALQAVGVDAKGRQQRIYSEAFVRRQAELKFSRVGELMKKQSAIFAQNEANLASSNHSVRENAAVMQLIQRTGIRPGSDDDTGAKVKAYGATTLEGRHVVKLDGAVHLLFIGKKGIALDIAVDHGPTADMLLERKKTAGDNGLLFATNSNSLREYSHTLNGGSFKPKDFRTLKGTMTAKEAVEQNPAPAFSMKEYKKRVMAIAKLVSEKLGNTPTIALQSYISPFVFELIKPQT